MTVNDSTRTNTYRPEVQNRLNGNRPGTPDIKTILVLLAVAFIVVFAAYLYGVSTAPQPEAPPAHSIYLENLFVDINGNGYMDYVVRAEVVFNNGPLPEAQPLP
jgi:hypothetical protein